MTCSGMRTNGPGSASSVAAGMASVLIVLAFAVAIIVLALILVVLNGGRPVLPSRPVSIRGRPMAETCIDCGRLPAEGDGLDGDRCCRVCWEKRARRLGEVKVALKQNQRKGPRSQ